jgi:hypothetical protein
VHVRVFNTLTGSHSHTWTPTHIHTHTHTHTHRQRQRERERERERERFCAWWRYVRLCLCVQKHNTVKWVTVLEWVVA